MACEELAPSRTVRGDDPLWQDRGAGKQGRLRA